MRDEDRTNFVLVPPTDPCIEVKRAFRQPNTKRALAMRSVQRDSDTRNFVEVSIATKAKRNSNKFRIQCVYDFAIEVVCESDRALQQTLVHISKSLDKVF